MLRMHAIKNNLTKKLGSLVSDESVFRHSIIGMLSFMVLLPLILKLFGFGRHDIYIAFNSVALFFLALLLGSGLLNLQPKEKREPLKNGWSVFCQRNPTVGRALSWFAGIGAVRLLCVSRLSVANK